MMNYQEYNNLKSNLTTEESNENRLKTFSPIIKILNQHKTGLDYGTGGGWLVKALKGWEGTEFKYPDKKFNCIASINVIEHQSKEDIYTFLDYCKKSSNYVLVTTNNPRNFNAYFTLYNDITHDRLISLESLKALLQLNGFEIIEANYFDDLIKSKIQKLFIKLSYGLLGLGKFNTYARYYIYAKRKVDKK